MKKQIATQVFTLLDPKMVQKEIEFNKLMRIVYGIMAFIGLFAIYVIWGFEPRPWVICAVVIGSILIAALAHYLGLLYFNEDERKDLRWWRKLRPYYNRMEEFHRVYNVILQNGVENLPTSYLPLLFLKKDYQDRIKIKSAVLSKHVDCKVPGLSMVHR